MPFRMFAEGAALNVRPAPYRGLDAYHALADPKQPWIKRQNVSEFIDHSARGRRTVFVVDLLTRPRFEAAL